MLVPWTSAQQVVLEVALEMESVAIASKVGSVEIAIPEAAVTEAEIEAVTAVVVAVEVDKK